MLAALRPHPHRGDPLAAGVVVLTVAIVLVQGRFDEEWARGVHVAYASVVAGLVLAMAAQSAVADRPRPYVSVLCVAGFALTLTALLQWAELLGGDTGESGTLTWVGVLLTALAAALARAKRSAIMTLVAAVVATATVLAAIDWVFSPDGASTFRYLLLAIALGLGLGAVRLRDARRRDAVALVDAAGIAIVALGLTLLAQVFVAVFFGGFLGDGAERFVDGAAWGWELVLVAWGFGLIAYGSVDREPGPSYLGVACLAIFFVLAALPDPDGPSLIGWPIVLLVLGGALVAIALRPRRELPPEPGSGVSASPTSLSR